MRPEGPSVWCAAGHSPMELSLAQTVLLPAIVAVAVLLLPRGPWCIQRTPAQIAPWTACCALPLAVVLAMFLIEGAQVFTLAQRWYALWFVAVVFAGAALPAALPPHMPRNSPILLAAAAALALFMLRLPTLDSWGARLLLIAVGTMFAGRFAEVAARIPRTSTLVLATSMGCMAVTLLAAGSLKVGLIASSLALVFGAAIFLVLRVRTLMLGSAFAASGIVILVSFAWYGAAYHGGGAVHRLGWAAIACSSALLCGLPLDRLGLPYQERRRPTVIIVSITSCLLSIACAIHALVSTTAASAE